MSFDRREFLKVSVAGAAAGMLPGCATMEGSSGEGGMMAKKGGPKVVVIGAGWGGTICAKYLRVWDPGIDVTIVDRVDTFYSCPLSNEVMAGMIPMEHITRTYDTLKSKYGIKFVIDEVTGIDTAKKSVKTANGTSLSYDKLVLSPGVDFQFQEIEGLDAAAQEKIVHAWKAGPQTLTLRRQIEAMPDGGVFIIAMPKTPYRCPPGPYERVCLTAQYFMENKPKSKIIMLDANEDVASKGPLFKQAWAKLPPGLLDYRPNAKVVKVDTDTMTVSSEFEDVKGDVINIIPPQNASEVTNMAGCSRDATGRWVPVDYVTYESSVKDVHVIGDAILSNYPKSGHMANNMGKITASALVEIFNNREPDPVPIVANTCYSLVDKKKAIHVVAVFRYDPEKKLMIKQPGGGISTMQEDVRELEKAYADAWATNIWNDMFS
jgi:sulfide dehydrogenase [flavocytochrome c] flavoprotein chain